MGKSTQLTCIYCHRPAAGTYREQPVCHHCIEDHQLLTQESAKSMPGALAPAADTPPRAPMPLDVVLSERSGREQAKLMLTGGDPNVTAAERIRRWRLHKDLMSRSRQPGLVRGALLELDTLVDLLVAELIDADKRKV